MVKHTKPISTFIRSAMDDIHYSRIRVIYVLHPCVVGFALRNVRYIFRRKMALVVFNIFVACHNIKNDSKKLFSSKVNTSYNNVCLVYIVSFVESACLSRVSACLISTWVAKSRQEVSSDL